MKDSIRLKLAELSERHEELGLLLSQPDVISDQSAFRKYSQEYAELQDIVNCFISYTECEGDIEAARALIEDDDPDMRERGEAELESAQQTLTGLEEHLRVLLLPVQSWLLTNELR